MLQLCHRQTADVYNSMCLKHLREHYM